MYNVDDYKDMIQDAFEKRDLVGKNHDYFSRIRGQIRAITDTKEEYEALRDDILGHYQKNRGSQTVYSFRMTKDKDSNKYNQEVGDKVVEYRKKEGDAININHDVVSGVNGNKFSVGFNKDFSKNEPCFEYEHIREMDNSSLKYFWTLGKNGVMITKYDVNSNEELPTKPHPKYGKVYMQNVMISDAVSYDNMYAPLHHDMFRNSEYGEEYSKILKENMKNNIYTSWEEHEKPLYDKFESKYHDECVELLDSNMQKAGLINQVTGEPLFKFAFAKSGR